MLTLIYTEERRELPQLVARFFDGFTVTSAYGYWRGRGELSAIIQIVDADPRKVRRLVDAIKREHAQEAVLTVELPAIVRFV